MDEESVKQKIRALLDSMQSEADPYVLNQYRAVFRKEVSLFKRSYMAAWLLMCSEPGGKKSRRPEKTKTGPDARRGARKNNESSRLPDGESARLFISVGRNRGVFPGEIFGLFVKAGISRDDIGAIRILDNYSFVQVRDTAADAAIAALNGQNFRGRTLAVNRARNQSREDAAPFDRTKT